MDKTYQAPHKPVSLLNIALVGLIALIGLAGCGGSGGNNARPSLTINSPEVPEGDNAATVEMVFTITLSEDAESTLTLDYTTADGTATEDDNDFVAVSSQVQIPQGSRTATISITINGDDDFEQNETFNLELSNPQGIVLSESSISGSGLINNDDDADPKGYFAGSGTFNNTAYDDVIALVYGGRILLFSPSANVMYDFMITTDVFDYTGSNVEVYEDGLIGSETVTVSGTTDELQIAGTFADGTRFGSGSFDVAFDVDNNVGATLGRIEATGGFAWDGNLYGIDLDTGEFHVDSAGKYFGLDDKVDRCNFPNPVTTTATLVIPETNTNIYQLDHPIESQLVVGTCATTYASTGHTGFASVVNSDTGTDNKLIFAFNNDNIALFGIMSRP